MLPALAWYAALQVIAVAAWPLVHRVFAPLPDRGWAAGKVLGLLLVAWLAWFLGMLASLPFTRTTVLLLVAVMAGAGVLATRYAPGDADAWGWARTRWRLVLVWEAVLALAFTYFSVLRAYDPAVVGTEKPMDMAFLNTFLTAERLPTQDAWLSGYGVPYYYFGFFTFALLGKLSGATPGVAYNLAAATVPALAVLLLAALAWGVVRAAGASSRWAAFAGVVASTQVILAGNLAAALEYLYARGVIPRGVGEALGVKRFAEGVVPGQWPPEGAWWWRASRVVENIRPDGINEFPFFSSLLSDLHPHFMALPFEVLVLTLLATHVLSGGASLRSPWTQGAAALAVGSILALNTWDLAPFWLLYVAGSVVAALAVPAAGWRRALLSVAAPLAGIALFAPYFVGYTAPPLGLGIVTERTPIGSFLVLMAVPVSMLVVLGLWARWCSGDRLGWMLAAGGLGLGLVFAFGGQHTLGLLVALVALLVPWPGIVGRLRHAEVLVVGLGAFAAAVLLGVEVIFLSDTFGTRMNTVFKFHYNAWLFGGLAGAMALGLVARHGRAAQAGVVALAVVGLVLGAVYPISASQTRFAGRPPGGPTLDGLAFLAPDERAAVQWLRERALASPAERPVVLEAVAGQYSSGARMATYSGATTVIGWLGHELQWRGPLPELGRREADVNAAYRQAPPDQVRAILDRYQVDYVVVGDLERQQYGPEVDRRFEGLLPLAFRSGRVTIYRTR